MLPKTDDREGETPLKPAMDTHSLTTGRCQNSTDVPLSDPIWLLGRQLFHRHAHLFWKNVIGVACGPFRRNIRLHLHVKKSQCRNDVFAIREFPNRAVKSVRYDFLRFPFMNGSVHRTKRGEVMTLHRCEWIWSSRLTAFTHRIRTFRDGPWKEVSVASDETVYWQGRPHRVYLRWGVWFFPIVGLALIGFACFELTFAVQIRSMAILVTGLGASCLICSFLHFLNLSNTTYLLTDRRICVDNNLFHIRREYDLPSYLKRYKGEFASYRVWQPGNRWDLCLIRSARFDGHANAMFIFFHSISKEDAAVIKRAESAIRIRHKAPPPDPRYSACHTICNGFRRHRKPDC